MVDDVIASHCNGKDLAVYLYLNKTILVLNFEKLEILFQGKIEGPGNIIGSNLTNNVFSIPTINCFMLQLDLNDRS